MAKRRTYDPEIVAQALRDAEGDVAAVVRALGISRAMVYRQRDECEVVREAYNEFRPVMLELAKSNIISILRNPDHPKNYDCSKFVLETQGKGEGFTVRQELTGADGGGLVVEFVPTDG